MLEQGDVGFGKIQSIFGAARLWGASVAASYAMQAVRQLARCGRGAVGLAQTLSDFRSKPPPWPLEPCWSRRTSSTTTWCCWHCRSPGCRGTPMHSDIPALGKIDPVSRMAISTVRASAELARASAFDAIGSRDVVACHCPARCGGESNVHLAIQSFRDTELSEWVAKTEITPISQGLLCATTSKETPKGTLRWPYRMSLAREYGPQDRIDHAGMRAQIVIAICALRLAQTAQQARRRDWRKQQEVIVAEIVHRESGAIEQRPQIAGHVTTLMVMRGVVRAPKERKGWDGRQHPAARLEPLAQRGESFPIAIEMLEASVITIRSKLMSPKGT